MENQTQAVILSSKLKIAIGIFSFIAIVTVSLFYYVLRGAEGSGPPTLQLDTASLSKGMMQDNRGLATFEGDEKFSCPSGKYAELSNRINNLYSVKAVSLKDVYGAIKPEAGLKVLIAFYSPGELNYDKNTFYIFPTSKSPFKGVGDVKIKDVKLEGGDYIIPANRGFKLMVSKNAKICGENFITANSKLQKSGRDYTEDLLQNLSTLPKGWVMVPVAVDKDALKRVKDVIGDYFDQGYLQSGSDDFEKIDSFSNTDPKFRMVWLEMNGDVDTAEVLRKFLEAEGKKNTNVSGGDEVLENKDSTSEEVTEGDKVAEGDKVTGGEKVTGGDKAAEGEGEGDIDAGDHGIGEEEAVIGDEASLDKEEAFEVKENGTEDEQIVAVDGDKTEGGQKITECDGSEKTSFSVDVLLCLLEEEPGDFYALDFAGYNFAADIALKTQEQLTTGINIVVSSADLVIKDFISKIIPIAKDHVVAIVFSSVVNGERGVVSIFPSKLADYFEDVVGVEDGAQLLKDENFVLVTNYETTVLGDYKINEELFQINSMSNSLSTQMKVQD